MARSTTAINDTATDNRTTTCPRPCPRHTTPEKSTLTTTITDRRRRPRPHTTRNHRTAFKNPEGLLFLNSIYKVHAAGTGSEPIPFPPQAQAPRFGNQGRQEAESGRIPNTGLKINQNTRPQSQEPPGQTPDTPRANPQGKPPTPPGQTPETPDTPRAKPPGTPTPQGIGDSRFLLGPNPGPHRGLRSLRVRFHGRPRINAVREARLLLGLGGTRPHVS